MAFSKKIRWRQPLILVYQYIRQLRKKKGSLGSKKKGSAKIQTTNNKQKKMRPQLGKVLTHLITK